MLKNIDKKIIIAILLSFSFFLGIFIPPILSGNEIYNDSLQYDNIARSLIHEKTYPKKEGGLNFLLAPGYPFFLAASYKIFGYNYFIVYFLQFLMLGCVSVLVFLSCMKYFNFSKYFSFAISLLILFWPYFILYGTIMYTEIFYTLLFFIAFCFLLSFLKSTDTKLGLFAGIFLALATLTRPIILLLPFWLLFFTIISHKIGFVKINKNISKYKIAIFFVGFILTLLPWVIYSYHRTGHITLIANDPKQLYDDAIVPGGTDIQDRTIHLRRSDIILAKTKNFFSFWAAGAAGTNAEKFNEKIPGGNYLILLYKIFYYILLFLFFLSFRFIYKKEILLIWMIVVYAWLAHTALFTLPRYTLPIIPFVLIAAFYVLRNANEFNIINSIKKRV